MASPAPDIVMPQGFTPQLPATPAEATTVMVHYYRAEMARMTSWRNRLDLTSNWSITVVAAMLSVSLSTPSAHHGVLLFAMLVVGLLLYVEGRRYRFYDVYRMRVRQFERQYFAQLFSGSEASAEPWLAALAVDLRHPKFRIPLSIAISRRLRRNYIWMFGILLMAWGLKISSTQMQAEGAAVDTARPILHVVGNAALGPLPGWLVLAVVVAVNLALAVLAFGRRRRADDDEVHV